jgi:hypothetical protein
MLDHRSNPSPSNCRTVHFTARIIQSQVGTPERLIQRQALFKEPRPQKNGVLQKTQFLRWHDHLLSRVKAPKMCPVSTWIGSPRVASNGHHHLPDTWYTLQRAQTSNNTYCKYKFTFGKPDDWKICTKRMHFFGFGCCSSLTHAHISNCGNREIQTALFHKKK